MGEKPIFADSKNSDEFLDSSKKLKQVFADLHIHSRYSRACSKNITIPELVKWAKIKGLGLLGTGDFTHNLWLKEIKEKLVDADYKIKLAETYKLSDFLLLEFREGFVLSIYIF